MTLYLLVLWTDLQRKEKEDYVKEHMKLEKILLSRIPILIPGKTKDEAMVYIDVCVWGN